MTLRELKTHLNTLTDFQLDMDVTVFDKYAGEYYSGSYVMYATDTTVLDTEQLVIVLAGGK